MVAAVPVEKKGVTPYLRASLQYFMNSLFHQKCRLRTDKEPAMVAVASDLVSHMEGRLVAEQAPTHSSASNGLAERAVRSISEQVRVMKLAVEAQYGARLKADHVLWKWLVRHAGFTAARFAQKASGSSAF